MVRTTNAKNKKFYTFRIINLEDDEMKYAKSMRECAELCGLTYQQVRTLVNLKDDDYKYNLRNNNRKFEIYKLKNKIKIENNK
tara:strand:- start:1957 stop:2205 length:249 start_codon:yes stop_codon:yes gene_type:complete